MESDCDKWGGLPPLLLLGVMVLMVLIMAGGGGCVEPRCSDNEDCPGREICKPDGRCGLECITANDCATGFTCEDNFCLPPAVEEPINCPADMVPVANAFCADIYLASRPDATNYSAGQDNTVARSVEGVLPWEVGEDGNPTAHEACEAADKRLCTPAEWRVVCRGPDDTNYAYGNYYRPTLCNGLDTFCNCDSPKCQDVGECPYPGCWHDCGGALRPSPTGYFPECTNGWGVYDINGNLWEHVKGGSGRSVRGGAFNCADSAAYHHCDYIPGNWAPSALGFRCCRDPL